jgi:hypothetical protein
MIYKIINVNVLKGTVFVLMLATATIVFAVDSTTSNRSSAPAADKTSDKSPEKNTEKKNGENGVIPDAKQLGGESDGVIQVANLVYAGTKSSHCFSDFFLIKSEQETAISSSRRFHSVKLGSDDIFNFPLVIMTGEGDFTLSDRERQVLKRYIERGGFLLASASCSSSEWDHAFRREMALIFPKNHITDLSMDHPVFHTVYDINKLTAIHGNPKPLSGITVGGRLGVLYSQDGLNDTKHTTGCCCCGGNELEKAVNINVNILAYALTY